MGVNILNFHYIRSFSTFGYFGTQRFIRFLGDVNLTEFKEYHGTCYPGECGTKIARILHVIHLYVSAGKFLRKPASSRSGSRYSSHAIPTTGGGVSCEGEGPRNYLEWQRSQICTRYINRSSRKHNNLMWVEIIPTKHWRRYYNRAQITKHFNTSSYLKFYLKSFNSLKSCLS